MKLLKSQLPKSPSKKLATVGGLVKEIGVELDTESKAHKTGKNKGLSKEIKDKVINFYYCSDIVYTAPGLKDEMTVWTEAGKTKMIKYYLTMYLQEVFAMFKAENQDCETGFSLFVSLRPKNVLLLKNQPLDQYKCSIHENSYLLLNALGVNIDKISFWQILLCDSEDYTSSCWKGECNSCNGKAIPFPNIIRNRIISYKEWGYNDQKRLTLKTLEYPFGEIKEKFCEQFPQFQKHVRIKQIIHDNFEQDKKDSKCHLLQVDFAMAYSCEYQNEVQSALWSHQTVNLFTAATYDTNGKEK